MKSETKTCQNCKNQFTIESEDFEFYSKIKVPPPTWCPGCRIIRRGVFRNERNFYKRICNLCKKEIVSVYSESAPFPVYCQECYWSDKWQPLDYGRDYDFSKPFFEQFRELYKVVPRLALINKNSVNSPYTHLSANNRDCYMLVESSDNENLQHGYWMQKSRDSVDNAFDTNAELCYETVGVFDSYGLCYSEECFECRNSWFLKNCTNLSNCFACINLKHKEYCFFNKQLTKEEYEKTVAQYNLETREGIEKALVEARQFYLSFPNKYAEIVNSPNSYGNYITNSKKCRSCFYSYEAEDSKYCVHILRGARDCYDVDTAGLEAEMLYECLNTAISAYKSAFINRGWTINDVLYSENIDNVSSCFGCISLRGKSYCIFNKQYSKELFTELKAKIIEQMENTPFNDSKNRVYTYGEFFPPEFSPFAYNETIAYEYFPMSKDKALNYKFMWQEPRARFTTATAVYDTLPKHIKEISDSIKDEIINCKHDGNCDEQCTKAFRVIPEELAFYKRGNIPLPNLCPNCRHVSRARRLNPFYLWRRTCQCSGQKSSNGVYSNTVSHSHGSKPCPNEFETSYAPDRLEIVYCESCYQSEVA